MQTKGREQLRVVLGIFGELICKGRTLALQLFQLPQKLRSLGLLETPTERTQ